MPSFIRVTWDEPSDNKDRGSKFWIAECDEEGWRFFAQFEGELRWFEEHPDPQLIAKANQELRRARTMSAKSRTPQVFRAGDPVDRSQEAFVERNDVVGEVEGQIMLATGCSGLTV